MRRSMVGLGLTLATPALAQQAPAPAPAAPARAAAAAPSTPDDEDEIVVTGEREVGSVAGDIPPEIQLSPADVRSYGVSSIADLLNELAPQTRSGRGGQPVVLLNGRRISSFAEIRDLPTEAILRVDILPEEAALKLGYSADQRVVNFVLRQRFRSTTVEAQGGASTNGGRDNERATVGLVHIRPTQRLNINLDYQRSAALLESQRDLVGLTTSPFDVTGNVVPTYGSTIDPSLNALAGSTVSIAGVPTSAASGRPTLAQFAAVAGKANVTDYTPYRTLLPSSEDFSANAVFARQLGQVNATLNGRVEVTRGESRQGLPTVALTVPNGNPFSPFGTVVTVDRALAGFDALRQTSDSVNSHLGASANGNFSPIWRWSVTGNYDRVDSKTFSETGVDASALQAAINAGTVNPFAPITPGLVNAAAANTGRSTSNAGTLDALVNGSPFKLPAGSVSTSLRVGARLTDFTSQSYRAGLTQNADVTRDIVNGQFNLDVPLTSRRTGFIGWAGNLTANFNYAADHLSDFGTLTSIGYGLNWSPIEPVRFLVSATDQKNAPTAQQLGNPQIVTPNSLVFDYVRGTTVTVNQVAGGNPGLGANDRHAFKAEIGVKPTSKLDLTITSQYTRIRTDDEIADFPTATAQVEAAFPDRFTRDGAGTLLRIDARPINYASVKTQELRTGFNLSLPIKSKLQKELEAFRAGKGPNPFAGLRRPGQGQNGQRGQQQEQPRPGQDGGPPPGADGGPPPGGDGGPPPGAGGNGGGGRPGGGFGGGPGGGGFGGGPGGGGRGGGGFGGRGGGGGQQGGGRLQFALYHTWHLEDVVTIRDGLPVLDLLNGAAIGNGGGQARHELEAQAGYSNNGLGVRFSADWRSGTTVIGGTATAPQTLGFSGLTTVGARLFWDPSQRLDLIAKHRWLAGARLTLSVDNLFNQRQRVTDQTGATPVSYQPDYLDPLGRTIRLSIRKLFYQRSAR